MSIEEQTTHVEPFDDSIALFLSLHQGFAPEVESKGWASSRKEAGMGVSSL